MKVYIFCPSEDILASVQLATEEQLNWHDFRVRGLGTVRSGCYVRVPCYGIDDYYELIEANKELMKKVMEAESDFHPDRCQVWYCPQEVPLENTSLPELCSNYCNLVKVDIKNPSAEDYRKLREYADNLQKQNDELIAQSQVVVSQGGGQNVVISQRGGQNIAITQSNFGGKEIQINRFG